MLYVRKVGKNVLVEENAQMKGKDGQSRQMEKSSTQARPWGEVKVVRAVALTKCSAPSCAQADTALYISDNKLLSARG